MIFHTIALTLAVAGAAEPRTLTLDQAVDVALQASPAVAANRIHEERARLATLRANLERITASVDLIGQALYVSPSFFGARPEPKFPGAVLPLANLEASAGTPLFSGFRVEADIARAEHLEHAVAEDLARERLAVGVAVARAYWSERRLALQEQTLSATSARLVESEQLVQARVNAGLAAGLDLNRAAARRAQLDVDAANLRAQRREARARLAALLAIDGEIELVDALPADSGDGAGGSGGGGAGGAGAGGDVNGLVQRALDARPELRAFDWRSLALAEEKRARESAYWPQLGAGVLVQLGNNPALAGADSRAIGGVDGSVQAGLTLRMNLFDTFATTHAVEDVAHRQRLAAMDRRSLARDVESDVRIAHARVLSLKEQRQALVKARDLVAENLGALERAYARGDVLFTEVLDVQLELANAERQIVDVDAQRALADIELRAATGAWAPGTTLASTASPASPVASGAAGATAGTVPPTTHAPPLSPQTIDPAQRTQPGSDDGKSGAQQ